MNCSSSTRPHGYVGSWYFQTRLGVNYVANLASRFHAFFLPVNVGVVEILVLTSICLRLGGCLHAQRIVVLNKCLAAGMLLWRFHSFITALLVGKMVG